MTGPFVTMVYSMITGDMLTFGIIYTVMLFGFSQSFYFLYKGFPGVKSSLYHSYPSTWMALFQITLGDYNVSSTMKHHFIATRYASVSQSLSCTRTHLCTLFFIFYLREIMTEPNFLRESQEMCYIFTK